MRLLRRMMVLPIVSLAAALAVDPAAGDEEASRYNAMLGRGVNLGNALDAPREGEWGLTLKETYFEAIRKAGFQSVRIPIRWDTHAGDKPPYEIEPAYFARVDWAIDQGMKRGLVVVINVHHDGTINQEPDKGLPRIEAYWRQIARRYRDKPDRLFFELLNEPHDKFTDDRWQAAFPTLLAAVRETNPGRIVIVGPASWNAIDHLDKLRLPESDRMLIATVHDYNPFKFTHQGAHWVKGSDAWKGTTWTGTAEQRANLRRDFDKVEAWSRQHKRPVFLGEFGAFGAADMASRILWTEAMAREAEGRGIAWSYWEFASGFGIYDPANDSWREPLLRALVPANPLPLQSVR
jgi:endoglucanase